MPTPSKQDIIDDLYYVLSSSISDTRFYGARVRGFRSELEFANHVESRGYNLLVGGQFLFRKRDHRGNNRVLYVTVASEDHGRYVQLYDKLSHVPMVDDLFFMKLKPMESWGSKRIKAIVNGSRQEIEIPEPTYDLYKFVNSRFQNANISEIENLLEPKTVRVCAEKDRSLFAYMSGYPIEDLAQIYANRFFLDVCLGGYRKGMIDIDGIIANGNNFTLVEMKEKDAGGSGEDKFFGWDSRRLAWYLFLKINGGIDSYYVIREVNNQTARELVGWKYITIDDFAKGTTWLSERGSTVTAPYSLFSEI